MSHVQMSLGIPCWMMSPGQGIGVEALELSLLDLVGPFPPTSAALAT